jgi:uncharacterized protein YqcC (DUF446 family)
MSQLYSILNSALDELEAIMRRDGLWHHKPPSLESMNSSMPFAVDTMEFTDWLQFIFIPRMLLIIQQQEPLPAACSIAPAAEVALMGRTGIEALVAQLRCIDDVFDGCPTIKIL